MFRPCYRLALLVAVVVCFHHSAPAQDTDELSADHGRLLASFDFEEQLRLDWSHLFLQEPTLPPKDLFFTAESDPLHAAEGERSLKFSLRGGSVSYRIREHVLIPAEANANYLARVWVRTEGFNVAAARIELRIVDEDLLTVEPTGTDPLLGATLAEFSSEPIRTNGDWVLLNVPFDTRGEAARAGGHLRIVPSLQIVQPNFIAPLGATRLLPLSEDVSGTAWFDGVEIWRMPTIDFYPLHHGVGFAGDPFAVRVMVSDPIDPAPTVFVTLRDLDGIILAVDEFVAVRTDGGVDRPLPITAPGWYDVEMVVRSDAGVIAQEHHSILALRPATSRDQRGVPRFGYSFEEWSTNELPAIVNVLDVLDPGVVEFSIWPPRNDDAPLGESIQPMRTMIEAQRRARRDVLFAIPRVHPTIALNAGTMPEDVATIFMLDASLWAPMLERWLVHFGTTVDRWRLASEADAPAMGGFPEQLVDLMVDLVADPVLSVPTPLDGEVWGEAPYLVASRAYTARAQAGLLGRNDATPAVTILVSPPPESWRQRDQLDAMAHRLLAAWRGGAERVLVPMKTLDDGFLPPMLAWATLGPALEGRSFQGELHASETATCFVADGLQGMLVVAWSDQLNGSERIELPLGTEQVTVESMDGRSWSVASSDGVHALDLTSTPIIIRDADPSVVQLASSMTFEPSSVESRRGPQRLRLVFENPFDVGVDGEIELLAPEGWSFEPARSPLHMLANGRAYVETVVRWDQIPTLGVHAIPVRLQIGGAQLVDARVHVPLSIVSPGLDIEADWTLANAAASGRSVVVVTMAVTNRGAVPVDLEAIAVAWRVGRERVLISNLQPGERAVRRIQFNVDLKRLMGHDIRLSVHEVNGSAAVAIGIPVVATSGQAVVVVEE